ncbi:MAG: site-specific integrase [Nitrososphaerales archaeon]
MPSLYERPDSKYYWWTARYKGRRLRRSTGLKQKHLAKKVQQKWDLNLALGDLEFLGLSSLSPTGVSDYIRQYLDFLVDRKSEGTVQTAKTVLRKFQEYLDSLNIKRLEEITLKVLDGFVSWLQCSPKTKKNYVGVITRMLDQAVKEEVVPRNPARDVTLPTIIKQVGHRQLKPEDLRIIFKDAGSWSLYFSILYHTGLRAGDVAMLTYGNIDRKKRAIVSFVRKSRRIHELPLASALLTQTPVGKGQDEPLFPELYADTDRRLKDNLAKPRLYMQALLKAQGRPRATLHSFRVTFNNTLRDMGLSIEDRQILLAHTSSETTKIYTHPNFDLASQFVNRIPDYSRHQENVTKT